MSVIPLSLSGKEFCVANEVHSWGSRPWPIGPTSSVVQQVHSKEGKDGEVVPTKTAQPRPSFSLKLQASRTQSTMRLSLHCSSDVTFGG